MTENKQRGTNVTYSKNYVSKNHGILMYVIHKLNWDNMGSYINLNQAMIISWLKCILSELSLYFTCINIIKEGDQCFF